MGKEKEGDACRGAKPEEQKKKERSTPGREWVNRAAIAYSG